MELKWVVQPRPDQKAVRELSGRLFLPEIAATILVNRGIDTTETAEKFLRPSLKNLFDPFMISGMNNAVDRVIRSLTNNEKIMIYGDYDVDGITSASLMFLVLNRLGANVSYYLPNRLVEGYGISEDGLQEAQNRNIDLLISVDCGITAAEEVEFAQRRGLDCIITDHHEPGNIIPRAAAIVNPKLDGENNPGFELSAVGVAYKFAQALYRKLGQDETQLEEHLDLVALGTSADIVPMIGENRILTRFGLDQVARTTKPGLKSLIFISGLMGQKIGTGQVVFILAPRINAIGRLGDAEKAIKLLTTRNEGQASRIARILNAENKRRKDIDEKTLNEALEQIGEKINLEKDRAIVLSSRGWHQGVIGIVASRLVERFHKPTVMIAIDGEEGKGSARSIPGFHLYDALKQCEPYLIRYGGHKYAAGLSIAPEKIESFRKCLNEVSTEMLTDEDLVPKLNIDAEIELEYITEELVDVLEKFAPFGPQNMRPVFVTYGCEIVGIPHIVGKKHLKFRIRKGEKVFDCIGFNQGEFLNKLTYRPMVVDLAYIIEYNVWNGIKRIQIRSKAIRISER
ncbi:MAG: single-stranded-DNA-specific exonuclease RecJ [Candidatus Zixiibacteriota bacterium]|nr:MAG: single-stranded-DNA-specific exonuclease RecJ [candidate division Zixibacteria bacterium]